MSKQIITRQAEALARIHPGLFDSVVKLRKSGMLVSEICAELGMRKSSELAAVALICDSMPRRYKLEISSVNPGSTYRIKAAQSP